MKPATSLCCLRSSMGTRRCTKTNPATETRTNKEIAKRPGTRLNTAGLPPLRPHDRANQRIRRARVSGNPASLVLDLPNPSGTLRDSSGCSSAALAPTLALLVCPHTGRDGSSRIHRRPVGCAAGGAGVVVRIFFRRPRPLPRPTAPPPSPGTSRKGRDVRLLLHHHHHFGPRGGAPGGGIIGGAPVSRPPPRRSTPTPPQTAGSLGPTNPTP